MRKFLTPRKVPAPGTTHQATIRVPKTVQAGNPARENACDSPIPYTVFESDGTTVHAQGELNCGDDLEVTCPAGGGGCVCNITASGWIPLATNVDTSIVLTQQVGAGGWDVIGGGTANLTVERRTITDEGSPQIRVAAYVLSFEGTTCSNAAVWTAPTWAPDVVGGAAPAYTIVDDPPQVVVIAQETDDIYDVNGNVVANAGAPSNGTLTFPSVTLCGNTYGPFQFILADAGGGE